MARKPPSGSRSPHRVGPQRTFAGEDRAQIAFPLGGIGTGSISVGRWGQLRDFEIFNKPAKGQRCPLTFFSLYARRDGDEPVARVLQGPLAGPREYAHGFPFDDGANLPHFADNTFTGQYPFARLDFTDSKVPLDVSMEAFNPMIPLEADDSSIPAAIFLIHMANPSRTKSVRATLFANLRNMAGHPTPGRNVTEAVDAPTLRGLRMTTEKYAPDAWQFGSMALATTWRRVRMQTRWPRLPVFDQLQLFWDQVSAGKLTERCDRVTSDDGQADVGSIALDVRLAPGKSATLPVIIAWHFPNSRKYWNNPYAGECCSDTAAVPTWKNHYATLFGDAWAAAEHTARDMKRLEALSRRYADVLYGSTLPTQVLDAAGSQASILKTTTCLRLPDGSFYGWEGCHPAGGCCEGTCSHVWNYAQTLAALYPGLQASAIENHFKNSLHDDGAMTFRMPLPLGEHAKPTFHPAADGQMGIVLGVYRHWLATGDDAWLRTWWPSARKALEYAWEYWDADRDGVMEGLQHNTYDIEFYGPNSMMTSLYLAALRAAARVARHLGEDDFATVCDGLCRSGREIVDRDLWRGDYYIQKIDPDAGRLSPLNTTIFAKARQDQVLAENEPPYQYGQGCLSDQLIGQWYAHMLDLGYVLDPEHVATTMASIFRYNFRHSLREHVNTHRVYAVGDEAGLLLCTWPHGHRETNPFIYAHEIWPGFEYQVACHLIYEGRIDEGLTIVQAIRDRHNGYHRNPWNEVECGNHYARSLASWALIPALSGQRWNASEQRLTFAPRVHRDDFRVFFSTGVAWGQYSQKLGKTGAAVNLAVEHGEQTLRHLVVDPGRGAKLAGVKVRQGRAVRRCIASLREDGMLELSFDHPLTVRPGSPLEVRWRLAGRK